MKNKITTIEVVTLSGAIALLKGLRTSGKTFRIDFVKKSTGNLRSMVCRMGVTKHLTPNPKRRAYNRPNDIMTVWEWGQGYKSLGMDRIIAIKQGNTLYTFNVVNNLTMPQFPSKCGTYPLPREATMPAFTSVLRNEPQEPVNLEACLN